MKVLIALDDEKFANIICDYAAEHANIESAEIKLISVIPGLLAYTSIALVPVVLEDLRDQSKKTAEELLMTAARKLAAKLPGAKISELVIEGVAEEEILSIAADWQADLIVVGSHGKHGLRKILLGSVSQAVVSNPPCSVLVVNLTKTLGEGSDQTKVRAKSTNESHFDAGISLGN